MVGAIVGDETVLDIPYRLVFSFEHHVAIPGPIKSIDMDSVQTNNQYMGQVHEVYTQTCLTTSYYNDPNNSNSLYKI